VRACAREFSARNYIAAQSNTILKQHCWLKPKRTRQPCNVVDADISLSPFHRPNICPMESCQIGESFLGQTKCLSRAPKVGREDRPSLWNSFRLFHTKTVNFRCL
jgi:hypothetical protein